MTLTLYFVRETVRARQYMDSHGEEFWVPKSVITYTLKYPTPDPLEMPLHQITIEDWWWAKHCGEDYNHDDE